VTRLAITTNPHRASPISAAEPPCATTPRVARSVVPRSGPNRRGGQPVTAPTPQGVAPDLRMAPWGLRAVAGLPMAAPDLRAAP